MAARSSSNNALAMAWMGLIVVCAGTVAWIYDAGRGRVRVQLSGPRVEVILPDADLSKVAGARPAAPGETSPAAMPGTPPPAMAAGMARQPGEPLAAVDPMLVETSEYQGTLPKPTDDPEKFPWRLYAAPFDQNDHRPRVAVLLTGLGLSNEANRRALEELPPSVSFSYSPYANGLADLVKSARAKGHEAWLDLALEPQNFPDNDPGPATLMNDMAPEDNVRRLEWVLARAPGVVGFMAQHGEKMLGSDQAMAPIAAAIRKRGLAWIDNKSVPRPAMVRLTRDFALPFGYADIIVTNPEFLPDAFTLVESHAGGRTAALLVVEVSPGAISDLKPWLEGLDKKGIALAPATAVVNRQPERFALAVSEMMPLK